MKHEPGDRNPQENVSSLLDDDYLPLTRGLRLRGAACRRWSFGSPRCVTFAGRSAARGRPWRRGAPAWTLRSTPSPASWPTWRAARPTSRAPPKYVPTHATHTRSAPAYIQRTAVKGVQWADPESVVMSSGRTLGNVGCRVLGVWLIRGAKSQRTLAIFHKPSYLIEVTNPTRVPL